MDYLNINGRLLRMRADKFFSDIWGNRKYNNIEDSFDFVYNYNNDIFEKHMTDEYYLYSSFPSVTEINIQLKDAPGYISSLAEFKYLQQKNETLKSFFDECLEYSEKYKRENNAKKLYAILMLIMEVWKKIQNHFTMVYVHLKRVHFSDGKLEKNTLKN